MELALDPLSLSDSDLRTMDVEPIVLDRFLQCRKEIDVFNRIVETHLEDADFGEEFAKSVALSVAISTRHSAGQVSKAIGPHLSDEEQCRLGAQWLWDDNFTSSGELFDRRGKLLEDDLEYRLSVLFDNKFGLSQEDEIAARAWFAEHVLVNLARALGAREVDTTRERTSEITRSLEFPPELKDAAVGLLSYFSNILVEKYPDDDVSVAITQQGNTVTMTVIGPEGERERIERTLTDYGLVMLGKLAPKELLDDVNGVMRLEHKLEIAELELRQSMRLLESERSGYEGRIRSLEESMKVVGTALLRTQDTSHESIQAVVALAQDASGDAREAMRNLLSALEARDDDGIVAALDELRTADRDVFDRVADFARNATASSVGSALWAAVGQISKMI